MSLNMQKKKKCCGLNYKNSTELLKATMIFLFYKATEGIKWHFVITGAAIEVYICQNSEEIVGKFD